MTGGKTLLRMTGGEDAPQDDRRTALPGLTAVTATLPSTLLRRLPDQRGSFAFSDPWSRDSHGRVGPESPGPVGGCPSAPALDRRRAPFQRMLRRCRRPRSIHRAELGERMLPRDNPLSPHFRTSSATNG